MMVSCYRILLLHCNHSPQLIIKELEPRRQRSDPVQAFIDLAATLEDHGEVNYHKFDHFRPRGVAHHETFALDRQ